MFRALRLCDLVNLNILDVGGALVKSGNVTWIRIGERIDVLESPKCGVTGPTALSVLVGDTSHTNGLLVDTDEGCGGVEEIECVSKLYVLVGEAMSDCQLGW